MLSASLLAAFAALANAAQMLISKGLTRRMPARELIGVLYLGNAAVLLPLAPFVEWRWTPTIVVLHLASVCLMVMTAIAVWDLLDAGEASAATTASALSPIPATIGSAVLVPGSFAVTHVVAAVAVTSGVVLALVDAFETLGRRGAAIRVVAAATGNGLLTVVTRLVGDEGVGVVETYVVRTALAAIVCIALFPPRTIRPRETPRLLGRSLVVTTYFVLLILAAQRGSPVVVQTLVATTPLLVLGWESIRARRRPPARTTAAAGLVVCGVAAILLV